MDKPEIVAWIGQVLERREWAPSQLADLCGVAPATILRATNAKTDFVPGLETLGKIATTAVVPLPRCVRSVLDAHDPAWLVPGGDPVPYWGASTDVVPFQVVTTGAAVEGTDHWPSDRHRRRPCNLDRDHTAFAFEVPGTHMAPWLREGSLAYASHLRAPWADDLVLVTDRDGASVVRLVSGMEAEGMRVTRGDPRDTSLLWYSDLSSVAVIRATTRD